MQAARALRQPMLRHGSGIFGKHRGIFHHALFEAHTMTVFQINRRNNQHGSTLEIKGSIARSFAADSALLFGFFPGEIAPRTDCPALPRTRRAACNRLCLAPVTHPVSARNSY